MAIVLQEKKPLPAQLLYRSSIHPFLVMPMPASYWPFLSQHVFRGPVHLRDDQRCHPVRAVAGEKLVVCKFKQK